MRLIDLAGRRFGSLTVLRRAGTDAKNKKVLWECECTCGNTCRARGNDLTRGKMTSCGCDQFRRGERANAFKHGQSVSRVRYIWSAMLQRCLNPRNPDYPDYGGRGITVCARWSRFEDFLEDMGLPGPGMTLERRDNDRGYSKENCTWASRRDQGANRRNSDLLTIGDATRCLAEWSRLGGVKYNTIRQRLKLGWSPREAVFTPAVAPNRTPTVYRCPSSSPLYRTWVSIRSRCRNPADPNYPDYGGRGIKVHPRWERFEDFAADVAARGPRPAGASFDRIDNDGDYAPGNCRWADQRGQIRNRRNTRKLTLDGCTHSLAEWAERGGIDLRTLLQRLRRGWDPHRAVYLPSKRRCLGR